MKFKLQTKFKPTGDQPQAIKKLVAGINKNYRDQTLLGITGSGKTFTMAKIIEATQKPTLVISHNKTLAAQLYGEFKRFFPENAVHYFVSYYDYYQPEAYIPQTDTYIEKETAINEEIDRLRHSATQSLLNRDDVLIVASVSCIYGLGGKEDYEAMSERFHSGQKIKRNEILRRLVKIQYERNDVSFLRGQFRAKGDTIDIRLASGEQIVRIIMFGNKIDKIILSPCSQTSPPAPLLTRRGVPERSEGGMRCEKRKKGGRSEAIREIIILPAKHFMTPASRLKTALKSIRQELTERLKELKKQNKLVEADRLEKKANYDLEMMEEIGYCNGIENYSRHLAGRAPGLPPETLIDFFPDNYLTFIDESHVTVPQIRGMYAGDQSRKQTLIDFGFRLPSARDNRPLNFKEFNSKINQIIYLSATPSEYEIKISKQVTEQIIRPTNLLDPEVKVKPNKGQISDLIAEIKERVTKSERILVTTLTKRMAEELADYLRDKGIKVQYLHSEIKTLERVDILRDLRSGRIDVLVGINLLREGLDLPEVSLVAILDADMSGFLRNETSLIQTMGRAARHVAGKVIMYANIITPAMRYAIDETKRRRKIQEAYNKKRGLKPRSIKIKIYDSII